MPSAPPVLRGSLPRKETVENLPDCCRVCVACEPTVWPDWSTQHEQRKFEKQCGGFNVRGAAPVSGISTRGVSMRGSPVYQVQQLWQHSGINRIGTSRHAAKLDVRQLLLASNQSAAPHQIAKQLGVHSYGTADTYRDVWVAILKHARDYHGIRDIEKLKGEHVASFLLSKVEAGVSYATYQQYAAATQKLGVALQCYTKDAAPGRFDFSSAVAEISILAKSSLERFSGVRAYQEPQRVIAAISDRDHRLAAQLQLTSGARVSEIALIKPEQLLGISKDPVTGQERGYIHTRGKGGRVNRHHTSPVAYKELELRIAEFGQFRIDKSDYRQSIKIACADVGCRYTGSHGFRWNRAAERHAECMAHGMTYTQALAEVALMLSHGRTSISEHYMRS